MREQTIKTPSWALAASLSLAYLALQPKTADLAAQLYRTGLFEREGFSLWDNAWYSGHHVPGYSLLFPPLAAALDPRLAAALAAVAATALFERLSGNRLAAFSFALGTAALLVSGRLTFLFGVAIGVGALLALTRDRPAVAAGLAVATSLASPVAALFLALCAAATLVGSENHRAAAAVTTGAALTPVALMSIVFPEGGTFPFVADAFWPPLAATLLLLVLIPQERRELRAGVALYAALLITAFLIPSPIGGNAVRLGALASGAVAVIALLPSRRLALALIAPALLYWQWTTPVDDWRNAARDQSTEPAYYAGMLSFLERQGAVRTEIPFTDNHWESEQVASRISLARGWERQLDREENRLFYEGSLTARRYERWLHDNAVTFVALPDAPIDYSAAEEAKLIRGGLSSLREVWRDEHWRVFAVASPAPIARGAVLTELGADSVTLRATRPGRILLRVRFTPYWKLVEGRGCVAPAGRWTAITLKNAGRVRLATSFSASRIRATSPRCTP